MLVSIDAIQVSADRRTASPEQVKALSESISDIGLLNPVTITEDNTLIAGLHRLEAARYLGWRLSAMSARWRDFALNWRR